MPTLCFHRRRLHRTAWLTLAAWLFAIGAGVVNACVLTPQGLDGYAMQTVSPPQSIVQAEHFAGLGDMGHRGVDGPAAKQGHESDASKATCLKFCDDESSALAKSRIPALDLGVAPLAAIVAWNQFDAPSVRGPGLSLEQPLSQGPPLVIRFLRLTL